MTVVQGTPVLGRATQIFANYIFRGIGSAVGADGLRRD